VIVGLGARAKTHVHLVCYCRHHQKRSGQFLEKASDGIGASLFLTQNYLQTLFLVVLQLDSSLCRALLLCMSNSCTLAGMTIFTQERDFLRLCLKNAN